jgi:hypothetical protein
MAARAVTKMVSAAAVALVVELTDMALERAGLSGPKHRILRKVLRSAVGSACGAVVSRVLAQAPDDAASRAPGALAD